MLNQIQIDNFEEHHTQRPFQLCLLKSIKKKRSHTKKTPLSSHNKHKFVILLSTFDTYKTSTGVAKETYNELIDDFKRHKINTQQLISKLTIRFTHPYLERYRRRGKTVGHKGYAYRCTSKGRRLCCELYYRITHGIPLNWEKSEKRYGGGKTKRKNHYNITCRDDGNCQECKYNPLNILASKEASPKISNGGTPE